ncbi:centromere protein X-like [Girardinichthys multiradiatus]|uniref:centromere protein X-like n=1 Tax=Girardinichthys multiradiatus TaxID=208333 RepID=UPI001FADC1B1|nr:centromere protein X-like [Girardinichthys multiradiatus]
MAAKEEEICFKKETVSKLLSSSFKEDKTKLSGDATQLMREMLRVFAQEAALRSLKQAESEDCNQVEIEHFKKILPQLVFVSRQVERRVRVRRVQTKF